MTTPTAGGTIDLLRDAGVLLEAAWRREDETGDRWGLCGRIVRPRTDLECLIRDVEDGEL